MVVRKGEANMTRKASGTEKSKKSRHMAELEEQDKLAPQLDEENQVVLDALVGDEGEESFEGIALEYARLTAIESKAAKRKEQLKPIFKKVLGLCGFDKIVSEAVAVEIVTGHTPRQLDATKLLEAGVHLDVINKCYVGGVAYKYTVVRPRKPLDTE